MDQENSFETILHESIVKPLQSFASRLYSVLFDAVEEDFLSTLQQDYLEERRLAQQLQAHAALMPNPLFRDTYASLIAATEHHASLLAAALQRHGTAVPADHHVTPAETTRTTIWWLIAADIAAIGTLSHRYQTQLGWMAEPQVRQLLHKIREEQQQQRRVLTDLLARIDSYAIPEINHQETA
jgi:hypothetical protein